jgi:hypothetical protein
MKGYGTYYWVFKYEDGKVVEQGPFDEFGRGKSLKEVDFSKVVEFGWIPFKKDNCRVPVLEKIDPSWQKPILVSRAVFTPFPVRKTIRAFLVGWQANVIDKKGKKKSVQKIKFVLPNGRIKESGKFNPDIVGWIREASECQS